MKSQNRKIYWLHTNHLGNSSRLTDRSGTMVYRGEYDPYGNLVYEWGSAGLNPRKFTGYERDATGLDYANARMYGPGRGRFMQPDPIGLKGVDFTNPQSLNRYSYAFNDPVNLVDPSGLFPELPASIMWGLYGLTVVGTITTNEPFQYNGAVGGVDGVFLPEEDWVEKEIAGDSDLMLRDTVVLAMQALRSKPECTDLFRVPASIGDAASLLSLLYDGNQGLGYIAYSDLGGINNQGNIVNAQTTGILGSITLPNGIRQSTFTGATIIININADSQFIRGYNVNGQQRFGVDDMINRAITLLHELGHAAAIISGFSSSIANDQNDSQASAANSQLVFDKCFK